MPSFRTIRTIAVSATACVAALCLMMGVGADPVWASGNAGPAGSTAGPPSQPAGPASLQIQAQELAGQIEADGRSLDELDAAYNAAEIRLQSLDARVAALQARMQQTSALVNRARHTLEEQAILAYITGGAPLVYIPDHPGQDPSLTLAYAEIIAGGQERAAANYRSDLRSMAGQSATLRAAQQQAGVTLDAIRSDQAHAATTMAAQKQALSQVKGQMAVLVAQVEQNQQHAAQQAQQAQQTQQTQQTQQAQQGDPTTAPAGSPVTAPRPTAPPSTAPPSTARRPADPTVAVQPVLTATTATTAAPSTTTDPTAATTGGSGTTGGTATTGDNGVVPPQAPGAGAALAYARAQLGKPYQWAAAGPDSFDCSGLVMMAWDQGGVHFPHLAQDQYDMTARIPVSQALPGDLVFFGTPNNVYHVGIYIGNGQMIDAPETGQNVSIQSVYWSSLLGAGRVHS